MDLTVQRNRGIAAISNETPYVGCFDDDFELKEDYLEQAVAFMNATASIIAFSGKVAANGNINRDEATALLASYKTAGRFKGTIFQQGKASHPLRL